MRRTAPDALVVDVGDALIRDRSPAITSQGASSVELLEAMGYDAMVLGAGDLGLLGASRMRELLAGAQFATLSADAVFSDTFVLPYLVRQVQGHPVALIGLTGLAGLEAGPLDLVQAVRQAVEQARQEAAVLVLLSHAGLTLNQEIAAQVPELDLILSGGGTGYTLEPYLVEGGPPIVQADMSSPGHAGRRVGVGTWWFDEQGQLVGYEWKTIPLTPDVADDFDLVLWLRNNP